MSRENVQIVGRVWEAWDDLTASLELMSDNRHTGRGEASRIPIEMDFWFVHTVSKGKVARMDMFVHEGEALEAAGLSE